MSMTKVLSVILLFVLPVNAFGQELLPREREREIMTSGRFYYGECSAFVEAEEMECAIRELTQEMIVDLVLQAISSSEEAKMRSELEIRAKSATLSQTNGRIRILAWIEKDSVPTNLTSELALTFTPTSAPTPTPAPTSTSATIPEPAPTPAPVSEVAPTSPVSAISNPVARELATCATFADFRRMADGLRRQGKLVYGAKASFVNPDNCFIAVFSRDQRLLALLDTGRARKDLLSGNTIQNAEQHFAGNNLLWIQINN
jgi:hypothetical protein